MAQNIVVCCDGTANEFARDRTNVVKLYFTLVDWSGVQKTYYHPGVGTMEPPAALTRYSRSATTLLGKAIGYGLEADIRDAYAFLMNHFSEGDRLFLFGFSRGAYTVRTVASLLKMYGLLSPGNEPMIPYAIRMMMAINNLGDTDKDREARREYFALAAQFRSHYSRARCKPYFVGVWDTVSSVGWIDNPIHLPYTASNGDIEIGRHAVAIDERRAFFRTNLWYPKPKEGPRDLKQVWFPGVHCDVGGGYPEAESGLSKISLEWMLREAMAAGLLVKQRRVETILGRRGTKHVPPNPGAKLHESLSGFWNLAEFVPKRSYDRVTGEKRWRANLYRHRTIPDGADVHVSASQRGAEYKSRLPENVVWVD